MRFPIQMRSSLPTRFAAVASLALSTLLAAQSRPAPQAKPAAGTPATLPATPPTTVPELPPTPAQLPAHQADVTYANGVLSVSASNSSLNQILHDISRQTGMKITGGVVDERVFGQYGPSSASQVLATLLDGTGSNMFLVQSGGPAPAELILTPRQGGPSPPNPNAMAMDDPEQPEDRGPGRLPQAPYKSLSPNQGAPANSQPVEYPASETTRQPDSPNGVKTPQQIYDQLQRLRQQQQQQQQQANPQ